jgi:hypothetical protein
MTEIKTYEEVYTGRTVNEVITVCIKADFYLFCIKELFAPPALELKYSRCK